MPGIKVGYIETKMFGAGLSDGGKTVFECADCGKNIGHVWHTDKFATLQNGQPLKKDVKFKCCYCKGESYTKEILGGFHYGGYEEETKLHGIDESTKGLLIIEVRKKGRDE